jgi:2-oxoglutarate dehydrogenase E1 component
MSAEDNWQVIVPSTPAQYFHLLRRQIHRKFRKPAIVFMPKALLRYEPASSRIEEFTDGTFQLAIDDANVRDPQRVRRVILCSGKIYYTLLQAQQKQDETRRDDVAIVRVEQLYPFPRKELGAIFQKYRNALEVVWVQEEPKNRGAWTFMEPRLRQLMPEAATLEYCGRDEAASPATGSYKMHEIEEAELISHALDLQPAAATAPAAAPQAAGSNGNGNNGAVTTTAAAPQPGGTSAGARQAAASAPASAGSQHPVSD